MKSQLQTQDSLSPISLSFFQALFSLFLSQKGEDTEGKNSCSSKTNNLSTFYPEPASLAVRASLLFIENSLFQAPESYPRTARFGCRSLFFSIIQHIFYITSIVYVYRTVSLCFVSLMLWMYIKHHNERSHPWGALHHR